MKQFFFFFLNGKRMRRRYKQIQIDTCLWMSVTLGHCLHVTRLEVRSFMSSWKVFFKKKRTHSAASNKHLANQLFLFSSLKPLNCGHYYLAEIRSKHYSARLTNQRLSRLRVKVVFRSQGHTHIRRNKT